MIFNQKEHLKKIANVRQEISCLICYKQFVTIRGFCSHLRFKHDISPKEYYDKFISKAIICPCGKEARFKNLNEGYKRCCSTSCNSTYFNTGGYKRGSKTAKEHSKRMKGNDFGVGHIPSNKGKTLIFTEEHKANIRKHLHNNVNSKGLNIPNGARCQFFEIEGLRCQGRYELAYIENLIKHNEPLPSKAKTITTPFGFYTPDFEFDNEYVEIKSTYTLRTCVQNGQMKRIKWVKENIKPVKIVVLSERKVNQILSEYLYM